jgi:O-antigen ligase
MPGPAVRQRGVAPSWEGWAAAAVPGVAVLAVDPAGLSPFGPVKWLAAVAVLVAFALAARPSGAGGAGRAGRAVGLAWLAFLGWAAASAVGGLEGWYAVVGTPERRFGLLTWVLCALAFAVGNRTVLAAGAVGGRRILTGVTVAIGCAGTWAAAEALGWRPLHLVGAGSRPVATLGSSAFLGAAAALLAPAALGLALELRTAARRQWSALAGVAAALGGLALVVAGARAAWVGAAVALAAVGVLRPSAFRGRRRRVGFLAAAGVVLALAAASGVAGRVPDAFDSSQGGGRSRTDEWRVAVRVVADHPILGVGPEGYRIAFGSAVDDRYEAAHGRDPLPDRAHDALLDVAATTGLPGLAAYLALVALAGRSVLAGLRRGAPWVAGAAAGLVAYAAQSLLLFPLAEVDPVAWLLAGLVVAGVHLGTDANSSPAFAATAGGPGEVLRRGEAVPGSWRRRLDVAGRAAAGGLAVVILLATARDLAADRATRRALDAVADGRPDEAAIQARRATDLRPDAVRYHLAAARVAEATGTVTGLDAAVADLEEAAEWSPHDPVVRGERARLLLERARRSGAPADLGRARDTLEALAADDPRNAEVLLRLGLVRQLGDDVGGAEAAWLAAERLAPASAAASADLAVAYAQQGRDAEAVAAARRAIDRDPDNLPAKRVLEELGGT